MANSIGLYDEIGKISSLQDALRLFKRHLQPHRVEYREYFNPSQHILHGSAGHHDHHLTCSTVSMQEAREFCLAQSLLAGSLWTALPAIFLIIVSFILRRVVETQLSILKS